ncbi:MAG: hypothetical protein ABII82_03325 [Verrucomicrobiota bacterium]
MPLPSVFHGPRPQRNPLGALASGLLLALVPLTAFPAPDPDPWADGLGFNNPAAIQHFRKLREAAPADTRLMLGQASALLGRQPETAANIERAAALLRTVNSDRDALASHRATARYLLGRIAQDHLASPDLNAAHEHYRSVMRDFPEHPLAGEAAVNLGYLLRWRTPALPPVEIDEGLTKLLAEVTTPAARRELLFLLGEVRRGELKDKAGAREALLSARKIGFETPGRNGDIDLLIASLSTDLGDPATAITHYRAFLHDYPRDNRATTVRILASELEATLASRP